MIVSNKYNHFSEDTVQYILHTEDEFLRLYEDTVEEIPLMENLPTPKLHIIDNLGSLGTCSGSFLNGEYYLNHGIYIDSAVLTSNHSLNEKINIIKHELGHYIANSTYNKECGHGPKWKKIMKEIGGEPEEFAPVAQYTITITTDTYKGDDIPTSEIHGYCTGCNKLIFKALTVDDYASALTMILFATHPIGETITSLINSQDYPVATDCCKHGIYLVGSKENMINGAKNTGLPGLVSIIEKFKSA